MITHTGVTVFVEVVDDDISVKAINDPPREGVLIEASGGTCNVGAQASIFLTWEVAKALIRGIEHAYDKTFDVAYFTPVKRVDNEMDEIIPWDGPPTGLTKEEMRAIDNEVDELPF